MNTYFKSLFLLLVISITVGCSTNKDRFINRSFHAVTAEYNILYNGNIALDLGKEELKAGYTDNFWEILPVERMQVSEEVMLPGQSKNASFQIAEDKAAKAIQRHSMYIDGKEENPQMDEAFLLLGKARYYDQRFIPALEAFNYILYKYPTSNNITHAQIWREKTNIRLDNDETAIKNLKRILEREEFLQDQDIADASAMLSQAYINLKVLDSAIAPIAKAAALTDNNEEKGRYLYIKGQLYNELGKKDSANIAFDEVIDLNRKSARSYMINAYLAKARNVDFEKEDRFALLELLNELKEDRENRPFLDIIHHEIGQYYSNNDAPETATIHFNNSLRTNTNNKYLHAQNYVTIADYNFDEQNYKRASNYYDSTLTKLAKNTREFRRIEKKRENLEDVVLYEELAARNDSILELTILSEEELQQFFAVYTNELLEKDNIQTESEQNQQSPSQNAGAFTAGSNPTSFYFYNNSNVSYGVIEFKRIWGDIQLADNWRRNPQDITKMKAQEMVATTQDTSAASNPKYDPDTYIALVPKDPEVIDSIKKERNFAYYQLGIIYKEKFSEYDLAATRLTNLLQSNPEERLILPAKYNLYKIYAETGQDGLAQSLKQEIISNYPDSRYAAILLNPNEVLSNTGSPSEVYASVYRAMEEEEYQKVIDSSEVYITRFNGDEIVPKFELLKATATGRLYGYDAYKEALNDVALSYPRSEEGLKAQQIINTALPSLAENSFIDDAATSDFKLIFPFSSSEKEEALAFETELNKAIAEAGVGGLKTSLDIYNPEQIFVVVHDLNRFMATEGLVTRMVKNKETKITRTSHAVSSPNYKIIQIHKNFNKFITSK